MMQKLFLCILLVGFTLSVQAQTYYPGTWGNWETKKPEEVGLNSSKIDAVIKYAQEMEIDNPRNMEINHYQSFGKEPFGYGIGPFKGAHNSRITWNHLLRQTSDWEGNLWGKPDWADRPSRDTGEWLNRELKEPGSAWEYNDTRVNVLALAAMNVLREPLPKVLRVNIMDKIGASPTWRWNGYENSWVVIDGQVMQAVSGGGHWGGGMFISARDQARFGYLTLRNGKWNNEQILSEEWIKMSRAPTNANQNYGFMNFFLNTDGKPLPSAPKTAFYHLGAGNNMVYVDQENDLVIVARWIKREAMDGIVKRVLEAVE